MEGTRLAYLFYRHLDGLATEEEKIAFAELLNNPECEAEIMQLLDDSWENYPSLHQLFTPGDSTRLFQNILNKVQDNEKAPVKRMQFIQPWKWVAAAIILVIATTVSYRVANRNPDTPLVARVQDTARAKQIQVAGGKQGAILTLANGEQIVLDELDNGVVANQNGAPVVLKQGQLTYGASKMASGEIVYNTVSTPRGKQFELRLSDGTAIWLNAASSLKYPTVFTGDRRSVEVTGEAYFEVAKNARMPFFVKINQYTEIEVLGTHFNVSNYREQKGSSTTLLEGSVRIAVSGDELKRGRSSVQLTPGQQAQVPENPDAAIRVVREADIAKVMAWKNGLFDFEDASLEEVMQQLSRWYDIDVVYQNGVPPIRFGGKMSRKVSLEGLLQFLERAGVHFRMEDGRRLVVLP